MVASCRRSGAGVGLRFTAEQPEPPSRTRIARTSHSIEAPLSNGATRDHFSESCGTIHDRQGMRIAEWKGEGNREIVDRTQPLEDPNCSANLRTSRWNDGAALASFKSKTLVNAA